MRQKIVTARDPHPSVARTEITGVGGQSQAQQLIDKSPHTQRRSALASMVDNSPRMIAQRKKTAEFGDRTRSCTAVIQRVIEIGADEYTKPFGGETNELIKEIDDDARSERWKRGWKTYIRDLVKEGKHPFHDQEAFIQHLDEKFRDDEDDDPLARPAFPKQTYDLAKATASVQSGEDMSGISLGDRDLAVPHRMPFADIRDSIARFGTGEESGADLKRWTDRILDATEKRRQLNLEADSDDLLPDDYADMVDAQMEKFIAERDDIIKQWEDPSIRDMADLKRLLVMANSLHGNVPDLGPHTTNNIPTSNRVHLHYLPQGPMSPGSKAAMNMSPHRIKKGISTTSDGQFVVTTDSRRVPVTDVKTHHKFSITTIRSGSLKPLKSKGKKSDGSDSSSSDTD